MSAPLIIRPMQAGDLADATRLFRRAFGTFLGLSNPDSYRADNGMVETRWLRDPCAALVAEQGDRIIGSNFATYWGSHGFFGPLTVDPSHWDSGVARALLAETMPLFAANGVRHVGLYMIASSPKHLELYRKFGFWPRFLTAIMQKQVAPGQTRFANTLSSLPPQDQPAAIAACQSVCDAVYPGLDLSTEIAAIADQRLGETLLLSDGGRLNGFALCHIGPGTEAGTGKLYVKFAALRPGPDAAANLRRLLGQIENLALCHDAPLIESGTNLARRETYSILIEHGFRTTIQGVAMHLGNDPGYNHEGVFVLDDWR